MKPKDMTTVDLMKLVSCIRPGGVLSELAKAELNKRAKTLEYAIKYHEFDDSVAGILRHINDPD